MQQEEKISHPSVTDRRAWVLSLWCANWKSQVCTSGLSGQFWVLSIPVCSRDVHSQWLALSSSNTNQDTGLPQRMRFRRESTRKGWQ